MIVYCAIAALAYLFYKWATQNNDYFEKRGVKFNKPVFLLGANLNMFYNKTSFPEAIERWYNDLKREKISGLFEFKKPFYFIRDPKLVKKMAVKDFDHFTDHRTFLDENIDKMFGKALIMLTGQKWRDMRSTLSPMFTGSKMRLMFNHVATVGQQAANAMKEQIKNGGDNVFEFKTLATKFTTDAIASCAFGIEVNSFKNPENEFLTIAEKLTNFATLKTSMIFAGYMMFPSLMKALKFSFFGKDVERFFQEAIHETMKVREEKGIIRHDMINLLMQTKKGNLFHDVKEDAKVADGFAAAVESQVGRLGVKTIWDDDDLAAQCFLFFLGGFDTVAITMSFMAHELTVNPDVQEKLFEEIQAMNEKLDGKTITYEQIQSLKYMDQVVCETLRKWPPTAATDRVCVKDYEVEYEDKKFTIEKGRHFLIPIFGLQRDPDYFPDPLKFDPERFSEENRSQIDPDTYLPFGIGPRNCIGSRFALMEIKTVIYYLLLNFKFEVTEKTPIPLKFAPSPITLKVEGGYWIGLKPRE